MAKTKYNKNNKKTKRKKTRRVRGGAMPTPPKVGPNSMFGFNLDFLGNYLPKIPEFMKIELPKLEMPTMNTFNPFATSKKNKCDICETEECKKHLEEKSNQGTQPTAKEENPTEEANKQTEEANKQTEEAKKPTEETNQVGGKRLKYKKKRTRRRKYNKKKQ